MSYPVHLRKLIETLKLLPGVGNKSAERFAFEMVEWNKDKLLAFASVVSETPARLSHCVECGCMKGEDCCRLCLPFRINSGLICIVSGSKEAFSLEATGEYQGLYHVLGGCLSPLDGIGPDRLRVESLKKRIVSGGIKEVIIALDSTLEGDATALFIKKELEELPLKITRLAHGLPMGSSLDYVDSSTLSKALLDRRDI